MRHLINVLLLTCALAACDGDDTNGTPDSGTPMDSGMQQTCDPTAGPEHVQLLNADLDDSVEVVKKTPRHPGQPGPEGLP